MITKDCEPINLLDCIEHIETNERVEIQLPYLVEVKLHKEVETIGPAFYKVGTVIDHTIQIQCRQTYDSKTWSKNFDKVEKHARAYMSNALYGDSLQKLNELENLLLHEKDLNNKSLNRGLELIQQLKSFMV